MKYSSRKTAWLAIAAVAALTAGCGANPKRQVEDQPGYVGGPQIPGSGSPYAPPADEPGTSPDAGADPSINFSFSLNTSRDQLGNPIGVWTSPEIDTDTLLKVKIVPGAAGQLNVPGSGFVANYGCISYNVRVGAQTITTPLLAVNGGSSACPNAPTSVTLNFSSRLTPGHGKMKVEISNARYDFYCVACYSYPWLYNAQWYGCNNYCPARPLYKNHTASGSIVVQVNGTSLD